MSEMASRMASGVKQANGEVAVEAMMDAEKVADAVVYMAAPSGKFITGEVLTVDGGQQMWGDVWPYYKPEWTKVDTK